ncbi:MAG: hypothetical protein KC589_00210 [Nanoarchaeota archaeon]|nr:hypothetical protein [Nanoarchaeota archaeon]
MGHDRIPIISEKKYKFEGIFDIKYTYNILVDFLENSRHYDVAEKDYDEKIDGNSRNIMSKIEAEQEFTDYYKVIIKYQLVMEGKDISIEQDGKTLKMSKGKAKIIVNAYIIPDFQGHKPNGPLAEFLEKVYHKYIGHDEFDKCVGSAAGDVSELITRFKQSVNATKFR